MKKKIFCIILIGTIFTFIIYKTMYHETTYFLALGDGLAKGITPYEMEGYSFNDYLKEELKSQGKLDKYIREFTKEDIKIQELNDAILQNKKLADKNLQIQQAIKKADIITVAIGMDEWISKTQKGKATNSQIENYTLQMNRLLSYLNQNSQARIIILSLYPYNLLTKETAYKINKEIENLANSFHNIYVDIANISTDNNYFQKELNYYPNDIGHKKIFYLVKSYLKN